MTESDPVYGYLISDIEGSTQRWEIVPDEMKYALKRHTELLTNVINTHGGRVENSVADSFLATFKEGNPLVCAYALQTAFAIEDWSAVGGLKIRIGVHLGPQNDMNVPNWQIVNRTARICNLAWGGQILLSQDALLSFDLPSGTQALDVGSFRLKGVLRPVKLFDLAQSSGSQSVFPPPRASEKLADNLPHQATPFFGRVENLKAVSEAFKNGSGGPVCVRGAGGVGKTRLAIEYALRRASLVSSYFVSLQQVSSTTELVSKIAGVLKFPFNFNESREEQLLKYLSSQKMILVLDNADELIGGVAFINRIAGVCKDVSVIVTSRVSLGLDGEKDIKITGLLTPPEANERLYDWPSYQLFEYSAQLVDPNFRATPSQEPIFREICDLLGGLPIAIKLAGQWMKILSMENVLCELRNSLDILNMPRSLGDDQNVGLFNVFEKSWQMLSATEKENLLLLTYFSESFDSQAAKQVLNCDVKLLWSLERRSLLDVGAHARFRFHPVIREYLMSKKLSEDTVLGNAHCDYYFNKFRSFATTDNDMTGLDQSEKLDNLFLDFPNLEKSWKFAIDRQYHHELESLVNAVFYVLMIRSQFDLAKQMFSVETNDPCLNVFLTSILANCDVQQGNYSSAMLSADRVLMDSNADETALAHALHAKGNIAHASGDLIIAEEFYEKALQHRVKHGDLFGQFYSYSSLAVSCFTRNDFKKAKLALKDSYRACAKLDNAHGFMTIHLMNGDVAKAEGQLDTAKVNYNRSLDYESGVKSPQLRAVIIRRLRQIAVDENDHVKALTYSREAGGIARIIGDLRLRVQSETEIGLSLMALRKYEEAKEVFLDTLKLSKELNLDQLMINLLSSLGSCFFELGQNSLSEKIDRGINSLIGPKASTDYSSFPVGEGSKKNVNADSLYSLIDELLERVEFKDLAFFD